jgi:NAD(P)-dependent dehydrogenase (short-subunit alcohol dehydrogenase family)
VQRSGLLFSLGHALRSTSSAGATVVLADRNEEARAEAVKALKDAGHQVIAVRCDVADETQAAAMVERTVAAFGRLDMAYNNAGILGPMCPMMEETAAGFDEVNGANLRDVWTWHEA